MKKLSFNQKLGVINLFVSMIIFVVSGIEVLLDFISIETLVYGMTLCLFALITGIWLIDRKEV